MAGSPYRLANYVRRKIRESDGVSPRDASSVTDTNTAMTAARRRGRPSTGRSAAWNLPVRPELKEQFKAHCAHRGLGVGEMLEALMVRELTRPEQEELSLTNP